MIGVMKAVITWMLLMVASTNLIGFVVRGLFCTSPLIEGDASDTVHQVYTNKFKRLSLANTAVTIFWTLLSVTYIGALYHFWNILLAGVAILEMCSRLPDLLWEIRHGKRVTKSDAPRGPIYYLATVLTFLCLPLTWFALNRWN